MADKNEPVMLIMFIPIRPCYGSTRSTSTGMLILHRVNRYSGEIQQILILGQDDTELQPFRLQTWIAEFCGIMTSSSYRTLYRTLAPPTRETNRSFSSPKCYQLFPKDDECSTELILTP
jgi:hypothetical protein